MQGRAFLVATAFLLLGAVPTLLHTADAQAPTSSLDVQVCVHSEYDAAQVECYDSQLPGTSLHLTSPGPLGNGVGGVDQTLTTNDSGQATFKNIPDGKYTLTATRTGFATLNLDAKVQGASSMDVLLKGLTVTVPGKATAPDGAPVADGLVSVCCTATGSGPNVRTAADGSFSFSTTAGYRSVSLSDAPGFQGYYMQGLIDGTALALHPERVPPQDALVSGTVRDAAGNPVSGVRVDLQEGCCYAYASDASGSGTATASPGTASPGSAPQESKIAYPYYGNSNHTRTDAAGRYSMHAYGGRSTQVSIHDDAYAPTSATVDVPKGGAATQDLVAKRIPDKTAHVTGKVTDAETGAGLQTVSFYLHNAEYGRDECANSGYGVVMATPAPAPEGKPDSAQSSDAMPAYEDPCKVTINADGSFAFDATPGYSVLSVDYQSWRNCTGPNGEDRSASAACKAEYLSYARTFDLAADAKTTLDIQLQPRAHPDLTLSGYLLDSGTGKAIPGASIWVYNQDNGAGGQATTDKDGSYRVAIRSGYLRIQAYAPDHYSWQGTLALGPGSSSLDISLTPGQEVGGCCCCYGGPQPMYADKAGAPAQHASSGTATSSPAGASQSGSADATAFKDLGGGLGPYDASTRSQATSAESSKGSPMPVAVLVAALVVAVAALRRRLDA